MGRMAQHSVEWVCFWEMVLVNEMQASSLVVFELSLASGYQAFVLQITVRMNVCRKGGGLDN